MSHVEPLLIEVEQVLKSGPLLRDNDTTGAAKILWLLLAVGILTLIYGIVFVEPKHFWGAYYSVTVFFLGLSLGSVMTSVIFQIVGAEWSIPIRRIGEAGAAFFPFALIMLAGSYAGKDYLFPWAVREMPGKEWWMQPNFVYGRYGILIAVLMFMMVRFIRMSLRRDVGIMRENVSESSIWRNYEFDSLVSNWKNNGAELSILNEKLSWNAPVIVIFYAIIVSLFSFDMVMGMDPIWYSNMFGGFIFIGNIYIAWLMMALIMIYLRTVSPQYKVMVGNQQFHDLGKLCLGFSILWAYLFFSQFLPMWYGNLPEETQWMILRTREEPWKTLSWITLGMCFIMPFILLLSRDLKKTPIAFGLTCIIPFIGVWLEKYVIIMPQLSPSLIPLGFIDIALFLGVGAAYLLSVRGFLEKYPIVPLGHKYFH